MSTGSKRKREAAGTFADKDLSATSDVWKACFGQDGNFKVIVEEPATEVPKDLEVEAMAKRTEFKVWASLLANWSPVFETMIRSDKYAESQQAQVVIQDFSAGAVEIFLRFLYCGSVEGSARALLEVARLADKYQVKALQELCMRLVKRALTAFTACEILASADRFHMDDLRVEALELIYTKPEEALQERPALRQELLEEILGSGLLCMEADALRKILQSWGGKDYDSLASFISIRVRSQHTNDVLGTLYKRYNLAGTRKKCVFVGWWVVVILGPEQREAYTMEQLQIIASGQGSFGAFTLGKGWVQWLIPHAWVYLQGFSFGVDDDSDFGIPPSTSFRIWCSENGVNWHLAYESHKKLITPGTYLACKRPPGLVKWFKLEVLEGKLSRVSFNIRGILQTSM